MKQPASKLFLSVTLLAIFCGAGSFLPSAHAETPDAALLEELSKLTSKPFRVFEGGIVTIYSNVGEESCQICLQHLQRALPKMRGFAGIPPDAPIPDKISIALFETKAEFDQFIKSRGASPTDSYLLLKNADASKSVLAAYTLHPKPMLARLRRETFLALFQVWISNPPVWLKMGLAECFIDLELKPNGQLAFGPGRGNLRDMREKVLEAQPSLYIPLSELVQLSPEEFERKDLAALSESWCFCRFLLEDETPRKESLLRILLAALDPKASAKDNLQRAFAAIPAERWQLLEAKWKQFITAMPETGQDATYREARQNISQRRYDVAVPQLDEAIKADADYERLYFFRGLSLFYLNKPAESERDMTQALALFPEYHAARFFRARARNAQGNKEGAAADFEGLLNTVYADKAKKELDTLKK